MRGLVLAILIQCWSVVFFAQAYAQQMNYTGTPLEEFAAEILHGPVRTIMGAQDQSTQYASQQIIVTVRPGFPQQGPIATFSQNGQPMVILTSGYLEYLLQYTEAFGLEVGQYTRPHFTEWWSRFYIVRNQIGYDGSRPSRPGRFAGMDDNSYKNFLDNNSSFLEATFSAALTEVLLHEIGHHVLQNTYNPHSASSSQMKASETAADKWATDAWSRASEKYPALFSDINVNLIGRLVALGALRNTQAVFSIDPSGLQQSISHPEIYSRLDTTISNASCEGNSPLKIACELAIDALDSLRNESVSRSAYERRAEAGEIFAYLKLGEIAQAAGDFRSACKHYENSVLLGTYGLRDNQINQSLGWCYQNRYAGQEFTVEQTEQLAKSYFEKASELGWLHARAQLQFF